MNEGLRPYWYDSSITGDGTQFKIRFYYPADINTIMLLDKTTGKKVVINLEKEGEYLYTRESAYDGAILRNGFFNNGDTVIYDQRQEHPIYSNRISKR